MVTWSQHSQVLWPANPTQGSCHIFIHYAELTVRACLELETGTAGSVSGCGASSDLQKVGSVGLQTIQSHVTTTSTEDGVAGLLLFLKERKDKGGKKWNMRQLPFRNKSCMFSLEWSWDEYNINIWYLLQNTVSIWTHTRIPNCLAAFFPDTLWCLSYWSPLIKQQEYLHTRSGFGHCFQMWKEENWWSEDEERCNVAPLISPDFYSDYESGTNRNNFFGMKWSLHFPTYSIKCWEWYPH